MNRESSSAAPSQPATTAACRIAAAGILTTVALIGPCLHAAAEAPAGPALPPAAGGRAGTPAKRLIWSDQPVVLIDEAGNPLPRAGRIWEQNVYPDRQRPPRGHGLRRPAQGADPVQRGLAVGRQRGLHRRLPALRRRLRRDCRTRSSATTAANWTSAAPSRRSPTRPAA